MATATEFKVTMENRPGTLAELMEALGGAGINIDGIIRYSGGMDTPWGGDGVIRENWRIVQR